MRLHRSKLIKTTTKPVPSQVVSGFSAVYTYLKKKKSAGRIIYVIGGNTAHRT